VKVAASCDLSIIPADEPERLAAVRRYDVLDTPPDGAFDRITAIAARRFGVPIAIISVVDQDRIWFKSHHGLDVKQIGRDPGLCASAILSDIPHILPDTTKDIRSLANPLVAGDFGLRFYAGVPLRTSDGYNLGTLCVIDKEPRMIDQVQIDDLKDLASVVMDQLELRLSSIRAVNQARMLAREIDHRVMNSLQFVGSMLTMQGRATSPEGSAQLKQAADRVMVVARVHKHFYANEPSERVGCLKFIQRICADLSDVLGVPISVEGVEAIVSSKKLQPIGLIVNELVTNAAKHGSGGIQVRFAPAGHGRFELSICDKGQGFATDFDPARSRKGLGMKLVVTLASQLDGSVTAGANPTGQGACFTVTFPVSA
jgi:two-component sensor histidine kinase